MATTVPILVQDLPVYISSKTGEPVTISKSDFLSLFDNLDFKPVSEPSITTRLNLDGSPYAYASVNFGSHEQAIEALSQINFTLINNVPIRAALWDQKTRSDLLAGENKIIIINLPIDMSISTLENTMNDFGHVIDCQIPTRYGKPLSYGIIQFDDHDDVIDTCSFLYKKSFDGKKVQVIEMPDKPVKKIQNLNKNFKELLYFSGKNESNQLFYKKSDFISPPISYPIQNLSLSYSVYSEHSIMILENEKAAAVGSNSSHQINHSIPQLFDKQTIIYIQNSKDLKIDSFSSAVCGSKYTLYLCNPTEKINHSFLALQSTAKNATVFDPGKKVPVALYGGENVSAAINSDGTIIFTNQKHFFFAHLPDNEKAIQLACTNKIIFALSKSGHLYRTPSNPSKNANNIEFSLINEVSDITFVCIAGTSGHALAVDEDGLVYGRGSNKYGQLGMNSLEEDLIEDFVRLPKFSKSKVVSVSCGVDHSLFLNERGTIYVCGNNRSGQLFLSKLEMDDCVIKPTRTPIKSGATFCIAGNGLSVAFLYSQPPPSTPNQKYEGDFIESDQSQDSENENNEEEEETQESDHQDSEYNDNENPNSEDNDNENSNSDGNDNENSNSDGNDNENSNSDGNDNENSNSDGNENSRSDGNDNENSRSDGNDNENSRSEDNDNENSRSEDNDNENLDNNGNENPNSDGNDNENNASDDDDDDKTIDYDASYKMQLKRVHNEINQIAECVSKHNEAINQFIKENIEVSKTIEQIFKRIASLASPSQEQPPTAVQNEQDEELNNEEDNEELEFDEENEEEDDEVNNDEDSIEKVLFSKGQNSLDALSNVPWGAGTTKYVEFFRNKLTRVEVIDMTSPSLKKSLEALKDGHPISVDFEWHPDFSARSNNPISLFQFCSSKGVLIVLNAKNIVQNQSNLKSPSDFKKACPNGISVLQKFFSSNSFYGKGMDFDKMKVKQLFGRSFQFEDIAVTRLQPHKYTLNFSKLVEMICGKTVAQFKDKKISTSKWNKRPLSSKQMIYAAFDAFATRLFWKHFVEKFGEEEIL